MLIRSVARPSRARPVAIGPPLTKIVGMSQRKTAMSMPGMILSQLGMQMSASKRCACTIVSTQSAISSRDGSEYFIPKWPMMMPSHSAIVLNRIGTPPASSTACLTYSPTLSRWTWPGTASV
jgi:hypothetical protein